ncbi:hypothetical protein EHI8A_138370 [Entamoeba histolytica HM-1:IMSS-B]|uniref:Ras family protein n=5 Tax=Entamoeba histolytica TaxID=5759 RepID=C4LZ22_ENTH1|nr:hypothetical protein EHI_009450 [Entamoeba histolytica HM-1:IMSS]EMH73502.1 hypothetical protein EHI8A_138370 [Entamoeba histolytica HM-1:IMSS-B]EMS13223.1 hypothetical protein KM1_217670 [Entamoeba histolytica HM-3:IMSS]ENY61350.1 hypothetical protein EHI7A_128860 [Entamoeba histolytica HM-1:IMSS-A]GAT94092.1 hypothetical protein CL6EHI_009450 [Entamoeba histolytica]EAL49272.1 hypothetical protein EHI_009450 [Entamoeba histolytica HM-1:IMSS]|eukprot:XP_654659.1 hypothetical protein EHI_009450 [Entamoeba histolytica HM-1:IMSS]
MSIDLAVNICVVGEPDVGKTTFVRVIKEGIFYEDYISTDIKTYYEYERTINDIRFHGDIIDFSGHELIDGNKTYFPPFLDGKIHIAAGSASDQSSIKYAIMLLQQSIEEKAEGLKICLILKTDLAKTYDLTEVKQFINEHNGMLIQLDCHDISSVNKSFTQILTKYSQVMSLFEKKDLPSMKIGGKSKDKRKDQKRKNKKKGKGGCFLC